MNRKILVGSALLLAVAAVEFGILGAGAAGLTGGSRGPAHERREHTATPTATLTATPASLPPCDRSISPPPGSPPCPPSPPSPPCDAGVSPPPISPPPVSPPCPPSPPTPPCDADVSPPPVSPPPVSPPCGSSAPPRVIQLSTAPDEIVCDGIKGARVDVRVLADAVTSVADGTPVFLQVLDGPGYLDPYVAYTHNGYTGTFVRFGPAPYPVGAFRVQVDVGRIEATIRIFCAPGTPPSPPPCPPSPPQVSPPCVPPTPAPVPCVPGGPVPVSPPACPPPPTPVPSIGGRISIGTPVLSGGNIVVPVLTSASQDPYRGFNVNLSFDTSALTFTQGASGGALETSGQGVFCVPAGTLYGRANFGCVTLGPAGTTSGGTLALLTFAREARVGCVTLHLFTYGPPDGGDGTTGTFTIPSRPLNADYPQQNTYGPDVSMDLADGSTGCAGAPPSTPQTTGTPGAATATALSSLTPTPAGATTATPTAVPTATSTPTAVPAAVGTPPCGDTEMRIRDALIAARQGGRRC